MNITVAHHAGRIHVMCPYSPAFMRKARQYNGRWLPETRTWHFDPREETNIRAALLTVYGWDEHAATATCTIELTVSPTAIGNDSRLKVAGIDILSRIKHTYPVWLGDGVSIVKGSFAHSAGSGHKPRIMNDDHKPVIVQVHNVPAHILPRISALLSPRDITTPVTAFETAHY